MTPISLRLPTSNVGIIVTPNLVIEEMAFVGTVQRKGDFHSSLPSQQHPELVKNPTLPSSPIHLSTHNPHMRAPQNTGWVTAVCHQHTGRGPRVPGDSLLFSLDSSHMGPERKRTAALNFL